MTFLPHTVPDLRERPRGPFVYLYETHPFAVAVLPLPQQEQIIEIWTDRAPHWVGYFSPAGVDWNTQVVSRALRIMHHDVVVEETFQVGLRLCTCGELFHGDKGPCGGRRSLVGIVVRASFNLLPAGSDEDAEVTGRLMSIMGRLLQREKLK